MLVVSCDLLSELVGWGVSEVVADWYRVSGGEKAFLSGVIVGSVGIVGDCEKVGSGSKPIDSRNSSPSNTMLYFLVARLLHQPIEVYQKQSKGSLGDMRLRFVHLRGEIQKTNDSWLVVTPLSFPVSE